MNLFSNMDDIANLIIRPARYTYKIMDLGNRTIKVQDFLVHRKDFQTKNSLNMKIFGSIYSKQSSTNQVNNPKKILIYLHCNSGCRLQGLSYLSKAIQNDFIYVVFDFVGSGISEGNYISLGFYQTLDLQAVISYLHRHFHVKNQNQLQIAIWGRSMGAVTAIKFLATKKYPIKVAVFDSPFKSLKQLFIQIGKQKTNFPEILLQVAYKYIRPIIKQKAQFDIDEVDSIIDQAVIQVPGVFIASKTDSLVPFNQIDDLFKKYKGQKEMLFIQESHNQARNCKIIQDVFESIKKYFMEDSMKKNYYSFAPNKQKQLSKKKLQLTIKSLSQRQLLLVRDSQSNLSIKKKSQQIAVQEAVIQRRQISCLLPQKKSFKILNINNQQLCQKNQNDNYDKIDVKRKPYQIKNFFQEKSTNLRSQNIIKFKNKIREQMEPQILKAITPKAELRQFKNKVKTQKMQTQQHALIKCDNKRIINLLQPLQQKNINQLQAKCGQTYRQIKNTQSFKQLKLPQNFRQVKCTQKVLQKIIEKQEKRIQIVNTKQSKQLKINKQRKTLQHIGSKHPPIVPIAQLKGIQNYRNSLQPKFKSQLRK